MRIALAGHLTGQGGVQTHFRYLIDALLRDGHELLVITNFPVTREEFVQPGHFDRVRNLSFRTGSIKNLGDRQRMEKVKRFASVARAFRAFRPQVYYSVGTSWLATWLMAVAPRGTHRVFHEVMGGTAFSFPHNRRDCRQIIRFVADALMGQAPQVIANYKVNFGFGGPTTWMPAFPEPLEETSTLPEPPAPAPLDRPLRACFFGRMVHHKHAHWLVQRWETLAPVLGELHYHGTGEELPLVQAHIAQNGLHDRVFCHGRYPGGQDYVNLLSSYDMLLLPTVGSEGSPLVLLEAMACGVPFVSIGVGGVGVYAEQNPDCIVVERAPDVFEEAVHEVARRYRAGEIDRGRLQRYYLERFSAETIRVRWREYLAGLPQAKK